MRILKLTLEKANKYFAIPVAKIVFKLAKVYPQKIVIDNFGGRGYGDNPKYIVDALISDKSLNLDIVWLVNDINTSVPKEVRKVKYNSMRSIYEYSTAKVWIDNIKNSVKPRKKRGQFYLQTWHGGIGLKSVEKQIENELDPHYVKKAKFDASQTDLMLSDSEWTTEIFHNWFWYNGKIAKVGFPRNDVLVKSPKEIIKKVYDHFSLDYKKKIVLYAPTFRTNNNIAPYTFDYKKITELLHTKFGKEYVFLLRLHPNVQISSDSQIAKSIDDVRIFNANSYSDVQELLLSADVIITDFSSLMFDAMIAEKKVLLYASDFNDYISTQRKLLFDLEQLPFPFSKSIDELHQTIKDLDINRYFARLDEFRKELGLIESGNAALKVKAILLNQLRKDD